MEKVKQWEMHVSLLKNFCLFTGARVSLGFLKSQNQLITSNLWREMPIGKHREGAIGSYERCYTMTQPDLREREREGRMSRCLLDSSADLQKAWQDHWRGVPALQVMNLPLESALLSLVLRSTASAPTSNGIQSSTYGAVSQLWPTTFEIWGHSHGHHSAQQNTPEGQQFETLPGPLLKLSSSFFQHVFLDEPLSSFYIYMSLPTKWGFSHLHQPVQRQWKNLFIETWAWHC